MQDSGLLYWVAGNHYFDRRIVRDRQSLGAAFIDNEDRRTAASVVSFEVIWFIFMTVDGV